MMTLERYSHVMHLTSQVSGTLRDGHGPRSTCCGRRCRPAPCPAPRRCGRWRSSTTSSRSSAARTPAWSATSTSPATSTPPSPSAPWWSRRRPAPRPGRRRHRGRQRCPSTRTSSAATRPRPCLGRRKWPAARRMTACAARGPDPTVLAAVHAPMAALPPPERWGHSCLMARVGLLGR